MHIDIETEEKKKEVYDLFDSFTQIKDIYEYYGVCKNTSNGKYIHKIAKEIGFDFSVYKERKKRYCVNCGNELSKNQKKFCSSSCAASYNNKGRKQKDETREKISEKLKKSYTEKEKSNILSSVKPLKKYSLRKRLIDSGILKYECAECKNPGVWNGKPLILQLHHIDGNHYNNKIENLQLLCPNCHSQTDNYCSKNVKKKKYKKELVCKKCGKKIWGRNVSGLCSDCSNKEKQNKRPQKEEIEKLYKELKTYAALSRIYNVSPNTIRKWLILYDII